MVQYKIKHFLNVFLLVFLFFLSSLSLLKADEVIRKINIIGNVFNSAGFLVYAMITVVKAGIARVNKVKNKFGLPSPFRGFNFSINTKAAP